MMVKRVAALVVLAVIILAIATGCGKDSAAKSACHDYVKLRLKSPSTADFNGDRVHQQPNGVWYDFGYVDSQNTFGGVVHSNFTCRVSDDSGTWKVVHFEFYDGGDLG